MTQEQFKELKQARIAAYQAAQEALLAKVHENKVAHEAMMREINQMNPGANLPRVNHERWVKEGCYDLLRYIKGQLINHFRWDRQEFIVPEPESDEKLAGGFTIEPDKVTITITIPRVQHGK